MDAGDVIGKDAYAGVAWPAFSYSFEFEAGYQPVRAPYPLRLGSRPRGPLSSLPTSPSSLPTFPSPLGRFIPL